MTQKYTYQLGFNAGYILRKYNQALITKLLPGITKSHEYLEGLYDGKKEYELEIHKDRLEEIDMLRGSFGKDIEREL